MSKMVTLREVLSQQDSYSGWLYLPPKPWTLDTVGTFVKADKDAAPGSDDHIPAAAKSGGWSPVLDAASIEDVVFNAQEQVEEPTDAQLLSAFLFYVENDAFIEFPDG